MTVLAHADSVPAAARDDCISRTLLSTYHPESGDAATLTAAGWAPVETDDGEYESAVLGYGARYYVYRRTAIEVVSDRVIISNGGREDIYEIDAWDGIQKNTNCTGGNVYGIAVDSQGYLWVSNYNDGTVSRLDPADGYSATTYTVGSYPQGVAIDANDDVWVANYGDDTVSRLDASNSYYQYTYSCQNGPRALAVDPGTGDVWVATSTSPPTVSQLVAGSGYAETTHALGTTGYGYCIAINTTITSGGNSTVWIGLGYDVLARMTYSGSVTTWALDHTPYNVAVDSQGDVWVTMQDSDVYRLELSQGVTRERLYNVGSSLLGLAIDAGDNIWVGDTGDQTLVCLERAAGYAVRRIIDLAGDADFYPNHLAILPARRTEIALP